MSNVTTPSDSNRCARRRAGPGRHRIQRVRARSGHAHRHPRSGQPVARAAVSTTEAKSETLGLLRLYVSEKATALGGPTPQTVAVHVRKGEPADEIAQLSTDVCADLVVVGLHKAPHLKNLFVGLTAERGDAQRDVPGRGRRSEAAAAALARHRHRTGVHGLRPGALRQQRPRVVVHTPLRVSLGDAPPPPLFVRIRASVRRPRLRGVGRLTGEPPPGAPGRTHPSRFADA